MVTLRSTKAMEFRAADGGDQHALFSKCPDGIEHAFTVEFQILCDFDPLQ